MIFKNDEIYDLLSVISRVVLPLSVLVTALSDIWGFAYGSQISATLCAIDVFIGSLLIASKKKYDAMKEGEGDDKQ